ncbi:helix-turn-helix domain-containing protein [Streptomyces sp. NPDC101175]|uniref:nSTAND1 domain-containing NTPase n=1 Tax=Streptomyces sp. NPDC101175 TaxID=3366123 RepID=UPI0038337563
MNHSIPLPPAAPDVSGPSATPGKRLRELRRAHKNGPVSLDTLARDAGYTKGYLSKIETGEKPLTLDVARACDRVLGTDGMLTRHVRNDQADHPTTCPRDACPYPGLASFEPADAAWFFGRERATATLVGRLADALREGGMTAVVAPSGAGKSSLLRAGLLPALSRGALPASASRHWPVKIFTPGRQPLTTLLNVLEETAGAPASLTRTALQRGGLAVGSALHNHMQPVPQQAASPPDDRTADAARPVLIIDQFEELFTHCDQDPERDGFLTVLNALVSPEHPSGRRTGPAALVVLGIRADYYGQCLSSPGLAPHMATGHLPLAPMSPADLRAAITEPATRAGLTLEPGLTEVILRDAGAHQAGTDSTAALPLLAHALRATWQQRTGTTLTVHGYTTSGGIHSAIEASAERVYTTLSPTARHAAHQLLLRLVHLDHEGRATRRRLTPHPPLENGPDPAATRTAIEALAQARLLILDSDHVSVAHEALLTAWPRLSQWISEDRDGLRIRQQLTDAADHWTHAARDPDLLYRGTRLAIAQDRTDQHPWTAGPLVQDFLNASQDREDRENQREKRTLQLLRLTVAALSVLLVIAPTAVYAAFTWREKTIANEVQKRALREQNNKEAALRRATQREMDLTRKLSNPSLSVRCPPDETGWCAAAGGLSDGSTLWSPEPRRKR